MMNRKKLTAVIASVALVAVLGIGGTLMYFTDKDEKTNVITMGKVDGSLEENTDDPNAEKGDDGITYTDPTNPGDTLSKIPTVQITTDSEDAYVRVKINILGLEGLQNAEEKTYAELLEAGLNIGSQWTKGSDGYYHYNVKLSNKDGEQKVTDPLFTEVKIPSDWGNEVAEKEVKINLQAELIQADNFEDVAGNILRNDDGKINGWANTGDIEAAN